MGEVVAFPRGRSLGRGGGDGSGDSMLEARVARLETEIKVVQDTLGRVEAAVTAVTHELKEIKQDFRDLRGKDILEIRTKLAFIEGRLQGMPSTWQLLAIVLMTWTLGTGLLFAVLQFG